MSVYVDRLHNWGGSAEFRWKRSCHLYADTMPELHNFAVQIGLRREWFQAHAQLPHYDLTPSRRRKAMKLGAVEHTFKEMIQHTTREDDGPHGIRG